MMFVTYDPNQSFPKAALFGRGAVTRTTTRGENGNVVATEAHDPPGGLASFQVEDAELVNGTDERFYRVVEGPALEAKTQSEIDAILAPEIQEEQERQAALDAAVQTLLNNSRVILDSMEGVSQARAALDSVIPIDDTSTQTIIDTIAQRQAAVMFLAANSLRASVHLAKNGTLPDNVIEAFLK